jgi:hypothetical protein
MNFGFNDKKRKVSLDPIYVGNFSGTNWMSYSTKTGDGYVEETAPDDGYAWGVVDATVTGASVVSSYGIYVSLYINNVYIGNFYSDTNTKKFTTPSFPVKKGDVVKIKNGYTENTIGIGLRGVKIER